jgi:hypothetical protein
MMVYHSPPLGGLCVFLYSFFWPDKEEARRGATAIATGIMHQLLRYASEEQVEMP